MIMTLVKQLEMPWEMQIHYEVRSNFKIGHAETVDKMTSKRLF